MMGSGKSTVGRLLAEKLGFDFYDTDALIEAEHGPISGIFATNGESHFRQLETKTLSDVSLQQGAVIATGGGLPCFADNMSSMQNSGIVIYMSCSIPTLKLRLTEHTAGRPLINQHNIEERLIGLLKPRRKYYEKAHYTVDGNSDPESVANEIMKCLSPNDN